MKGTYDNIRYSLSNYLDQISVGSLANALSGIQNVEQIRQSTETYLAGLENTDIDCMAALLIKWNNDVEATGSQLSQCSYNADIQLSNLVGVLHTQLDYGQRTSTVVQNIVVNTMAEWNPVNSADELSYLVSVELEKYENNFDTVIVPELEVAFGNIFDLVESLPQNIGDCSAVVEASFRVVAANTENAANSCVIG